MRYHQTIYNRLRRSGLTEAGSLGFLGNWQCESGCEPNRLQGDFNAYRSASKDYTAGVTNGSISRYTFGSDEKGYGLAQWTFVNKAKDAGRKYNLYDFWKRSGKALDDVDMQVDFCLWELKSGGYAHVWPIVTQNNDLYTCVDQICRLYEQPDVNNVGDRFEAAKEIKSWIDLSAWEGDSQPEAEAPIEPETEPKPQKLEAVYLDEDGVKIPQTWPPRTIDAHCSGWPEVWLMQALMKCHGYSTVVDGIWSDSLGEKVEEFQRQNGLYADRCAGPMTWAALGLREDIFT